MINLEELQDLAAKRNQSAVVGYTDVTGYAGVRGKHEFNVFKGGAQSHIQLKPDLMELDEE